MIDSGEESLIRNTDLREEVDEVFNALIGEEEVNVLPRHHHVYSALVQF